MEILNKMALTTGEISSIVISKRKKDYSLSIGKQGLDSLLVTFIGYFDTLQDIMIVLNQFLKAENETTNNN